MTSPNDDTKGQCEDSINTIMTLSKAVHIISESTNASLGIDDVNVTVDTLMRAIHLEAERALDMLEQL